MSMTRQISATDRKDYFDRFTRDQLGDNVAARRQPTIEVISMQSGDQYEALTTRLLGLVYDPQRDAFEVQLEDLSHFVQCPAEILGGRGSGWFRIQHGAGMPRWKEGDHLRTAQRPPGPHR